MKKRILTRAVSFVLVVAMLFSLPVTASAKVTTGSAGGSTKWSYDSSTRTLTFSGTGSTGDYDYFAGSDGSYVDYLYGWRQNHATKVVVEAGITRLGECFICGAGPCIKEVVLPNTLTSISGLSFGLCEGLRTINIPVSVKEIYVGAFAQCGYTGSNIDDSGNALTINYEGTRAQWNQINFIGDITQKISALNKAKINYLGEAPYPGTPFTDIANHWGREPIKWVYEQGLFSGVSGTEFGPQRTMNRGMLVTVLHRLAGEPAVGTSSSFGDVANGQYYSGPVSWAYENDIVSGIGGGNFGPSVSITRQQLAKILYGYAVKYGKDTSINPTVLQAFSDAGGIASWARDPMAWAVTHGVLNGSNGKLRPKDTATRVEVAQIFYNSRELLA